MHKSSWAQDRGDRSSRAPFRSQPEIGGCELTPYDPDDPALDAPMVPSRSAPAGHTARVKVEARTAAERDLPVLPSDHLEDRAKIGPLSWARSKSPDKKEDSHADKAVARTEHRARPKPGHERPMADGLSLTRSGPCARAFAPPTVAASPATGQDRPWRMLLRLWFICPATQPPLTPSGRLSLLSQSVKRHGPRVASILRGTAPSRQQLRPLPDAGRTRPVSAG
jgi:hypothetical protein